MLLKVPLTEEQAEVLRYLHEKRLVDYVCHRDSEDPENPIWPSVEAKIWIFGHLLQGKEVDVPDAAYEKGLAVIRRSRG